MSELKSPDLADGFAFKAILLVRKVVSRTARNDNTFLSVELGDRTGSFSCTCFSDQPAFEFFRSSGEGTPVVVDGKVDHYQGRFSPRINGVETLTDQQRSDSSLLASLVECPPEPAIELAAELNGFVDFISHPALRATVQGVLEELGDRFVTVPAAVAMHHAYRHGLLEHTVHMARACQALLPLYTEVDPDLAMAGVILHDTGKALEYEGDLAHRKSRVGVLQGHVVLGYRLVRKAGLMAKLDETLLERLEHIILSHQGELEWGAATMAATPEAVFVSMVDNLDARMGMVQRALRQTPEAEEFSDFLGGLKTSLLTSPVQKETPAINPESLQGDLQLD